MADRHARGLNDVLHDRSRKERPADERSFNDGTFMNQPIKPPQEAPPQRDAPSPAGSPPPARKPRSARGFVTTGLVLLVVVAGIVWWARHQGTPEHARNGRNAVPMSIVPEAVGRGDIGVNINALGTVTSLATVTVRTQISGYLMKIDFK